MFKFRLLLFFVGVIALILFTPPINSQTYGYGAPAYPAPYGYGYAPPAYPAYGNYGTYGAYGKPAYGSSEGCGYLKVIEVLDQIFCGHIDKRRYSSTIYPYIEVIIDEIEYTKEYVCIPNVYDYLTAAQHELETLQDAVYGQYEDSSLLKYYDEFYEDCEGCATQQNTGTQGGTQTQGQGKSTRVTGQARQTRNQQRVEEAKTNSMIFLKQKQAVSEALNEGSKISKGPSHQIVEVVDIKQRAGGSDALLDVEVGDALLEHGKKKAEKKVSGHTKEKHAESKEQPIIKVDLGKTLRKRLASSLSARKAGQRKTRGSEYSDYTCTVLPYAYCEEEYYDELLYNILNRLWTALDFLWEALVETWFFMMELDCHTLADRCALIEASIMYGAIGVEYYFLVEVADYVWRMYELIELDYGDQSYYRAGGGSPEPYAPMPSPTQPQYPSPPPQPQPTYQAKKPVAAYIPSAPAYPPNKSPVSMAYPYPFGAYMGYSVQQAPQPQQSQPLPYQTPVYRPARASGKPYSAPKVVFVG